MHSLGAVGSGKSSLLLACLEELRRTEGISYRRPNKISYCSQQHLFISGTIRENILLNEKFDEGRYWRTVTGVSLDKDIQVLIFIKFIL